MRGPCVNQRAWRVRQSFFFLIHNFTLPWQPFGCPRSVLLRIDAGQPAWLRDGVRRSRARPGPLLDAHLHSGASTLCLKLSSPPPFTTSRRGSWKNLP